MDLVDMIERRRFVGREFLLWLWFQSEVLEQEFRVKSLGAFRMWPEMQVVLRKEKEETRIKGALATSTPEAKEALLQGKMPVIMRFQIEKGEQEFGFVINGDSLGLSGAKIPAQIKGEIAEVFDERALLLEELEELLEGLCRQFLAVRLHPEFESLILPLLRRWAQGEVVEGVELSTPLQLMAGKYLLAERIIHGRAPFAPSGPKKGPSGRENLGFARRFD